jgi:rod shape determining protein RodA
VIPTSGQARAALGAWRRAGHHADTGGTRVQAAKPLDRAGAGGVRRDDHLLCRHRDALGGGALLVGLASVPAIYAFVLEPYQRERVDTLIAGITGEATNGLGESYQIEQAKIAIGAGGLSGRGYLQGIQSQQEYVPEQHTDFILTIIAEEFGFIGADRPAGRVRLPVCLVLHGGGTNRSWFGKLATIGATSTIAFFAIFNSGMVLGLLPVLGMPLPLISYGGTALITVMACFGLILSAHLHRDEKLSAVACSESENWLCALIFDPF